MIITDIDVDAVAATCEEIGAAGFLGHDVRQAPSHQVVAERALEEGPLVAWFNNAGVGDDGRLTELSEEQVRRLVEVNLLGAMWGTRAALSAFGASGGDVVNIASLAGLGPVPGYSVYAATKAGVVSLSQSVNAESPDGVRVHALCPDGVDTAMLAGQNPDGLGSQLVYSGGRILSSGEVADAAVALVGSSRVVQAVPAWRGGVVRVSALAPSVAGRAVGLFAAHGRKAMAKRRTD